MTDFSADRGLIDFEPHALRRFIAISAAALIAFGAICWIAANWSAFHRLTKLEMAGGLLAVSALIAIVFVRARVSALLVATGAVGGLFALIGQTYPSGADAWQLFALWAALALPFIFAARHDAVWSLWVVVVGAAIGLWKAQEHPGHALADWAPACAMAIAVAVALGPWLPLQRLTGRSVWAFRLAAFGAIALLGWAGLEEGLLRWRSVDDGVFAAALAALVVICLALAFLRPLELGVLAIAAIAVDALLVFRIARAIDGPKLISAIVIAFIASGIVALSVLALREASRRARGDGAATGAAPDGAHEFSWPLAVLTGFGALIAAVPFLIVYGVLFETLLKSAAGSGMLGALTLAAAVFILRGGQAFGFRQMFGVIAAFVGLALLAQAIGRSLERDAGFALCLIAAATAFAIPSRGARSIFGFVAAGALIFSLFARAGWRHPEIGVALTSVVAALGALAIAASALIAGADRQKVDAQMRSFALGWTVACLVALIALAGRPFLLGAGSLVGDLGGLFRANWRGPAQAASIALAFAGPALLLYRRTDFRTPLGFAVALAGIALAIYAPTLGATVFILACALLAPSRGLAAAAGLATIWIVSALYYSLALPLAQKGYILIGMGAILGSLIAATSRRENHPGHAPARGLAAAGLVALGLAANGAIAGTAVRSAEDILANGREIYIALVPVDPRSLMQGDYMTLAFDTSGLFSARQAKGEIAALATVDDKSVARLQTMPESQPDIGPARIAVTVRAKANRWFVGSDAWFFQEGRAHDFAGARYGIFRVGSNGRLLLTGLADKDLKRLP
jgi:uncharacterized membrane-anchored protein